MTCVAVLAPWMIRNATTFEKFVPLSTNGNEVMVYANCASGLQRPFVGYWDYQCQQTGPRAARRAPRRRVTDRLYWRSLGFDYARDHVGELPRVVTLRVLRQWELFRPLQNVNLGGIEGRNRDASTMGLMMFYGLAGLSIVGAVSMRRRRIPLMPLGVQFLSVTITSAYTYGTVRFRAPAEIVVVCPRRRRSGPGRRRWRGAGLHGARPTSRTSQTDAAAEDADRHGAPFVLGGFGGLRPRSRVPGSGVRWRRGPRSVRFSR